MSHSLFNATGHCPAHFASALRARNDITDQRVFRYPVNEFDPLGLGPNFLSLLLKRWGFEHGVHAKDCTGIPYFIHHDLVLN